MFVNLLAEFDCLVDGLVKKLEEMEKTAGNYRSLMEHTRRLLKAFFDLSQSHRGIFRPLSGSGKDTV